MSSLPGYTLEDYVAWRLDIVIEGQPDPNFSLFMAEALGTIPPRPVLSQEEFKNVLDLYEPFRQQVEYLLREYDEEAQSWRDYAEYGFDFIPDETDKQAYTLIHYYKHVNNE